MIRFPINKRKTVISSIVAVTLLSGVIIAATPGSSSDPLITLSYFEQKMENLQKELEKEAVSFNERKYCTAILLSMK